MKKYIWKSVFMVFIMTWMGCTQDAVLDVSDTDSTLAPGEALVKIALSPEAETRAPRPLAWPTIVGNRVDEVKFFLYIDEQIVTGAVTIKNNATGDDVIQSDDGSWTLPWKNESDDREYVDPGENQSAVLRLTGLREGVSYKIVAYGYSYASENNKNFIGTISATSSSMITCTYPTTDNKFLKYRIEEVFSGSITFTLDDKNVPEVNLTRDVAGFMLCLYNIPGSCKDITIKKIRNYKTFQLNLSLPETDYNGRDGSVGEFIYKFAIEGLEKSDDGMYILNDYIFPDDMGEDIKEAMKEYLNKNPNNKKCLFVSFFMIPDSESTTEAMFSLTVDQKTYTLQISQEDGSDNGIKRNHFYYLGTPEEPYHLDLLGGEN